MCPIILKAGTCHQNKVEQYCCLKVRKKRVNFHVCHNNLMWLAIFNHWKQRKTAKGDQACGKFVILNKTFKLSCSQQETLRFLFQNIIFQLNQILFNKFLFTIRVTCARWSFTHFKQAVKLLYIQIKQKPVDVVYFHHVPDLYHI